MCSIRTIELKTSDGIEFEWVDLILSAFEVCHLLVAMEGEESQEDSSKIRSVETFQDL